MTTKETILVVDDDPDLADALVDVLADAGYPVTKATAGGRALTMLRDGLKPCIILLDLGMPDMDGYEFLERLAEDSDLASIPVALLTAEREVDRSRIGPDVVFLRKPIELDHLKSLIATVGLVGGKK